MVKDCLKNEVQCEHLNEDGSHLNFSAAIRIFAGRVGEADGLLNQHTFAFKAFQQDYFQNQHIPKEGCKPYEHGTRIIRVGVTEGSMLLTREELVKRGWYCDDIFYAGLDIAYITTHIYPIFDSHKLDVWGGMAYQPLIQQPIIAQLTML